MHTANLCCCINHLYACIANLYFLVINPSRQGPTCMLLDKGKFALKFLMEMCYCVQALYMQVVSEFYVLRLQCSKFWFMGNAKISERPLLLMLLLLSLIICPSCLPTGFPIM